MDNIVWVIIAAAITIALGGILLYAGNGTLGDVFDEANKTLNTEPCDTQVCDEDETTTGSSGSTDSSGVERKIAFMAQKAHSHRQTADITSILII